MRWYIGMFSFVWLYVCALFASVAEAQTYQSSVSCANVRCASGTCIDTPQGPVCQPRVTCASVLCERGNTCQELSTGPTCVAITPKPNVTPHYQKPSRPGSNACYRVRDYYLGQSFYRTICPQDRVKQRRWKKRDYNPHVYRPYRPYQPPRYTPPQPTPRPDAVCAQIYAPVCAEKRVQCIKAPCPPVQQTFSNACMARNAGYAVKYDGTCRPQRWTR